MFKYNPFFLIIFLLKGGQNVENSLISDINSLSELPLDKLLKVKNTIYQENIEGGFSKERFENENSDHLEPQALYSKLQKTYQPSNYWPSKSGKKGITTLFQISVTALAFLAFGGYLLCLLIQAIKNKNFSTITLMTTPLKSQRKKRKSEEVWPNSDPEDLYRALRLLSEGYANYYEADFKFYNSSKHG